MRDPRIFSPWVGAWIVITIFAFAFLGCPTESLISGLDGGSGSGNDTTAPVPGGSGMITASNIRSTSLDLSWTAATDETTPQGILEYRVYLSESDNIDSVSDIEDNGDQVTLGWTAGLVAKSVTNLNADSTYYLTVIVRDEAENIASYDVKTTTTDDYGNITIPSYAYGSTTNLTSSPGIFVSDESADPTTFTFSVENSGSGVLYLENPAVDFTNTDDILNWAASVPTTEAIDPGNSSQVTISMSTDATLADPAIGAARIHVYSDDPDQPDYYFNVEIAVYS